MNVLDHPIALTKSAPTSKPQSKIPEPPKRMGFVDLPSDVIDRIGSFLGDDAAQLPKILNGSGRNVFGLLSVRQARVNVARSVHEATAFKPDLYDSDDVAKFQQAGRVLHLTGMKTRTQVLNAAYAVDESVETRPGGRSLRNCPLRAADAVLPSLQKSNDPLHR